MEFDKNKGLPVSANILIANMVSWNAFDPVNEALLGNIITAIKKTFMVLTAHTITILLSAEKCI